MAGTEQTRIEVLLDGRQASDQLKDLSKNAAALRIELAKAYQANDAGKVAETEWELSKLNTRMKQLRKETVDVQTVLNNLSGATMSDLRQSIASVDARLNSKNIKRNSEEWNKLTEVKRTLIAEQKRLRQEMGALCLANSGHQLPIGLYLSGYSERPMTTSQAFCAKASILSTLLKKA